MKSKDLFDFIPSKMETVRSIMKNFNNSIFKLLRSIRDVEITACIFKDSLLKLDSPQMLIKIESN